MLRCVNTEADVLIFNVPQYYSLRITDLSFRLCSELIDFLSVQCGTGFNLGRKNPHRSKAVSTYFLFKDQIAA